MARDITSASAAAITASHVKVIVFVELQFATGTLRYNNGNTHIEWGGHTWLGAAAFTRLDPVEESAEPHAAALKLQFSGLDATHLDKILNEQYQGRPARIWVAPLDAADAPIMDPVLVFSGRMDEPEVTVGETFDITLALENRWADWDRARVRRYTDADQQAAFPGDRFCEYVALMESAELVWGTYKGPAAPTVPSIAQMARNLIKTTGGNLITLTFKPVVAPVQNFFRRLF